jgi:hypothetical protein
LGSDDRVLACRGARWVIASTPHAVSDSMDVILAGRWLRPIASGVWDWSPSVGRRGADNDDLLGFGTNCPHAGMPLNPFEVRRPARAHGVPLRLELPDLGLGARTLKQGVIDREEEVLSGPGPQRDRIRRFEEGAPVAGLANAGAIVSGGGTGIGAATQPVGEPSGGWLRTLLRRLRGSRGR